MEQGAGRMSGRLLKGCLFVTTQVILRRKGEMGIRKGKYIIISVNLFSLFSISPFLLMLFALSLSQT
jgi:hypothetical protein